MDEAAIGSWLQNSDSREKCARYYHRHNIYDCRDHHRHRHLLLGSRERCVQIYRSCSTVMYKHLSEVANKRQKKKIYIYIYIAYITAASTISTTSASSSSATTTSTSTVVRSVTFARNVSVLTTIVASLCTRFRAVASDMARFVAVVA